MGKTKEHIWTSEQSAQHLFTVPNIIYNKPLSSSRSIVLERCPYEESKIAISMNRRIHRLRVIVVEEVVERSSGQT